MTRICFIWCTATTRILCILRADFHSLCLPAFVAELDQAMEKAKSEEIRIPFGVGVAGQVAQTKQLMNIKNAYEVSLYYLKSDFRGLGSFVRNLCRLWWRLNISKLLEYHDFVTSKF